MSLSSARFVVAEDSGPPIDVADTGDADGDGSVPLSSAEVQALVDASVDVVLVLDAKGRYCKVGLSARGALYRPPHEMVGRCLDEVLPPDVAVRCLNAVTLALSSRKPQLLEYSLVVNHVPVWFEATIAPTTEGTVVWVARDVSGRRQAEAAVAASEQQYRTLIEQAFDGVLLCDGQLRALDTNPRFCAMVGLQRASVLARSYTDFMLPEDLRARPLRLDELYAERRLVTERRFVRADGVVIPAEVGTTLLDDGRVLFVVRDLTERRRAEAALRESEARFRAATDGSLDGFFILRSIRGPDGAITDFEIVHGNACARALISVPLEQVMGRGVCELLPEVRERGILEAYARVMETGEVLETELEPADPRVSARWVHVQAVPLGGGFDGLALTMRDITERKASEAAQRRLTAILESMPDIVATATPDGRLSYLNAAGRRLLGLDPPATEAAAPAASVPGSLGAPLTVAEVQPQFAVGGALASAVGVAVREGLWRGETTLQRRDGRELPVEQILLAHTAADGSVEYMSTVIRDITERKQTEATLRSLSLVDDLTGLYNRRGFLAFAEREWQRAQREGRTVFLFYLDLDDFKAVNDTYGHAEGDSVLRAVAGLLRSTFREADVVARLGGDEFTALAAAPTADAEPLMRMRLASAMAAYNAQPGRIAPVRLSMGVASADLRAAGGLCSLAALMVEADQQLYEEKRSRKAGRQE